MSVVTSSFFFFSSRRRHTRCGRDWSSDVCSSDLVGSTLRYTVGEVAASPGRHHRRARVWSAVTGSPPEINPVEGPAANPPPRVAEDQRSSPIACAAAVGPAPVTVVPAKVASTPNWRPPADGTVTADRFARPRPAHSPPGSEAIELERSATSPSLVYRTPGERIAEPKLVPPG